MKSSRKLALIGFVGALVFGAAAAWSQRRVSSLELAVVDFAQVRTTRQAALDEANFEVAVLKAQLPVAQSNAQIPASYEEWSRRQAEARIAVVVVQQKIAELTPSISAPVARSPEWVEASQQARLASGNLLGQWTEYEGQGSGLTPPSRAFAARTLVPLIAEELEPALTKLVSAERDHAERTVAALGEMTAKARRNRNGAGVGLIISLGAIAFSFVPNSRRKPSVPAVRVRPAPPPAEVPEAFVTESKRVAADSAPGMPIILVADPSSADGEIFSMFLRNAGYAVVVCDDAPKALAAVRAVQFHLVILNQRLPGGNGLEVLREARQRNSDIPAIFVSSPGDDPAIIEASGQRVSEIIRKPADPRTLLWRISEIFHPGENLVSRDYPVPEPDPADNVAPESVPAADGQPDLGFASAPEPIAPPASPVMALPIISPPETPVSAPPAPDPAPPLAPEPAPQLAPEPAAVDGGSSPPAPSLPRKKLVRRKLPPPEETETA